MTSEQLELLFEVLSPFVTFYIWFRIMLWMICPSPEDNVWWLYKLNDRSHDNT